MQISEALLSQIRYYESVKCGKVKIQCSLLLPEESRSQKNTWFRNTSNILSEGRKRRKKCLNLGYWAQQQAEKNLKCKNLDHQREGNPQQREGSPSLEGKLASLLISRLKEKLHKLNPVDSSSMKSHLLLQKNPSHPPKKHQVKSSRTNHSLDWNLIQIGEVPQMWKENSFSTEYSIRICHTC